MGSKCGQAVPKRSDAELRSFGVTWQLLRRFRVLGVKWHLLCSGVPGQQSFSKGHYQTDEIIRKAGSVLRVKLHTVEMVAESKMLAKVSVIMKNPLPPPL